MPNSLAYLALLAWPAASVALFLRLRVERALVWSILGAYLLLPPVAKLDLPLLPALDKVSIPNLAALLACLVLYRSQTKWLPRSWIARGLILLFLFSPFATVANNSDPIFFFSGGLPGLRIYDAFSVITGQVLTLAPFLLARRYLASETAQGEILMALVIAGIAYSVPMLIEIRLSPQINTWVYGFFQHSFAQMVRYGGYRPIVFLEHGLWLAFFTMICLLAAVAMRRASAPVHRGKFFASAGWLALLLLCKSAAAIVYAAVLVPVVALVSPRLQTSFALALALIAVTYPLLRGMDVVPVNAILAQAERWDSERAQSFDYRIDNEDVLLERAKQKSLFGWGGWGRNQIYDPITGKMLSVTDGRWIIVIGTFGWFGYVGEFGLLALPLALLWRRARRMGEAGLSPFAAPLGLILAINMIDVLPNATLTPLTWLMAGAVLGYSEARTTDGARVSPPTPGADERTGISPATGGRPRSIL